MAFIAPAVAPSAPLATKAACRYRRTLSTDRCRQLGILPDRFDAPTERPAFGVRQGEDRDGREGQQRHCRQVGEHAEQADDPPVSSPPLIATTPTMSVNAMVAIPR